MTGLRPLFRPVSSKYHLPIGRTEEDLRLELVAHKETIKVLKAKLDGPWIGMAEMEQVVAQKIRTQRSGLPQAKGLLRQFKEARTEQWKREQYARYRATHPYADKKQLACWCAAWVVFDEERDWQFVTIPKTLVRYPERWMVEAMQRSYLTDWTFNDIRDALELTDEDVGPRDPESEEIQRMPDESFFLPAIEERR